MKRSPWVATTRYQSNNNMKESAKSFDANLCIEEKHRPMRDIDKSKEQLVSELAQLRQRIAHLEVLASEYEQASERLRSEEAQRRRSRELTLLNQIIAASASALEPKAILETACRELAQAFEVSAVAASLLNAGKSSALVVAEYLTGGQPPALNGAMSVKSNPALQHLLTHKAPLVVVDAQHDPRLAPVHDLMRRRGTNSLLMVPLVVEGEVAGSLSLEAREAPYFSAAEVSLIWNVADQVSGVLARAQLAQNYRQLSIAIEQAAESVIILDPQGIILYINPAFEKVTGYSRAEAIGQTLDMLQSGEHDPAFYQEMWAILRAGKVWHGRIVNRKKDGTLYTDDATITPVRDENGSIINYVQVTRDVTRELQLEEQFRQTQKMEAVGRLTAGIAHDFNNLLTAINGFVELAQVQLPPDAPAQDLLGKVRHSGERAAGLVRQLLAFSATQVVEAKVVDANSVVAEMDKMLRQIIGEDIELTTHLAPDLWTVKLDPSQLEQVIVNLAVNARDAMPRGGRLIIETANVALEGGDIASHLEAEPGEYVLLTVKDTGVGMDDAVKAHLFEPFFTTKERGKGTGLGLATVYGIVKQSSGYIWVDSQEGVGTTFKIYLPRCREAPRPLSQPREERGLPLGGETILVVEDDDQVRTMVKLILAQQGYLVLEAADGQQALRLAADHAGHIQLLLTDVVLRGINGPELAHGLAQSYPDLKTLYISGYPPEEIAQYDLLAPDVAALQKPFTPMDLARKVRQVLDSH
jgi:PAS domain S-box-containing protein